MNPEVTRLLKEVYTGELCNDDSFIWTDDWVHIWNDMNEPACFMPNTEKTMAKSNFHNFGDGRIFEHRDVHSLYGHYNAKATYHALMKRNPAERPFILTRSFNAGT